jgi:hypothetical protein
MDGMRSCLVVLAGLTLFACSRRPVPFGFTDGWYPPGDGARDRRVLLDGQPDAARDAGRDHPFVPTCTPGARLTYVVDDNAQVRSFDPTSPSPLALKGTLSCPLAGHPHSMAVRHDGVAYVLYSTDYQACSGLARVDLTTLSCTAVPAFKCQTGSLALFGMGYALAGPAGEEQLFIAGMKTPQLARLDPETGKLTIVGNLPAQSLELTGNSKGELWGFSPDPKAMVFRLDPNTAVGLQSFTLGISTSSLTGSSWAFASSGGAFFIFYGFHDSAGTTIYRLTPDGKLTTFLADTGINIVGAGNAVCAGL